MFNSILTSVLRATKKIKIPGGSVSLGFTAKQTFKSPPPRKNITTR